MPAPKIDTLIIGQGLAGSLLAWTLIRRGHSVLVRDDHQKDSASRVAAGLINLLAGMRFNRLPHVVEMLDYAGPLYRDIERALGRQILHEMPMVRLFRSAEQRRFHERQLADPDSAGLLGDAFESGHSGYTLGDAYGGFHQQRTGYIATVPLLEGLRDWLLAQDALQLGPVDSGSIALTPEGIRCDDIQAKRVVFCEGWRLRDNPWFNWLPLQPAKGEILTLADDPAQPDRILNGGTWLVPLADGGCKVGATVDHQQLDTVPTEAAREYLLTAYRDQLPTAAPGRVLDQQAGVRPNTQDRRPFLGPHPQHPELVVFNGFGGRGSLTIPWHAARLADWLEGRGELPAEADIRRLRHD